MTFTMKKGTEKVLWWFQRPGRVPGFHPGKWGDNKRGQGGSLSSFSAYKKVSCSDNPGSHGQLIRMEKFCFNDKGEPRD